MKILLTFRGNQERAKICMADRKKLKTVKRGRPKKENCANDVCRVCETNLWVKYGSSTAKSFANLFKPSLRDDSFGVVWA